MFWWYNRMNPSLEYPILPDNAYLRGYPERPSTHKFSRKLMLPNYLLCRSMLLAVNHNHHLGQSFDGDFRLATFNVSQKVFTTPFKRLGTLYSKVYAHSGSNYADICVSDQQDFRSCVGMVLYQKSRWRIEKKRKESLLCDGRIVVPLLGSGLLGLGLPFMAMVHGSVNDLEWGAGVYEGSGSTGKAFGRDRMDPRGVSWHREGRSSAWNLSPIEIERVLRWMGVVTIFALLHGTIQVDVVNEEDVVGKRRGNEEFRFLYE
ncbi:hypothetical protein JB92DRAFT_2833373 [Gautieria morchelliformis]|nr:hypothetical protein JB92DRAFT_2833373 [Gautieria morchelliformis]